MRYHPHTPEDESRALETIGVSSVDELFSDIPQEFKDPEMGIGPGMDEAALLRHLRHLAAKNVTDGPNFLGGGLRPHFIPAVTPHLAFQSEFVTAYTPYQPEVSQGILQATFEYQTMMCELTGLPVSNASMYDGASATAEAALLTVRHTRRDRVMVSRGVHPETRAVLQTYLGALGIELTVVDLDPVTTSVFKVDQDVAGVIVQQPNFLGYLEDMRALTEAAHAAGALMVAVVDPLSLAVLSPPGEYGADIAVGDGQTLGNPLNFGGPSFGFMVVDEALLRQFPGRIVGETLDAEGKRAYVLTLQAREQHIRRSKAKSNICTNHQLTALMAAVNVAALGAKGLQDAALGSAARARDVARALRSAGLDPVTDRPHFAEFVLPVPMPGERFRSVLATHGVHAGVPVPAEFGLGDAVVMSATETVTNDDIDRLVQAVRAALPLEAARG